MHRTLDEARPPGVAGMTLIELMLVIAIVAIIATLAWPSFTDQMRKGRRVDAISSLYKLQLDQERYRSLHYHYADTLAELGWTTNGDETANSPEGYYVIELESADASAFRASATPRAGTDQVHDRCQVFMLDQSGPDLNASSEPACWSR